MHSRDNKHVGKIFKNSEGENENNFVSKKQQTFSAALIVVVVVFFLLVPGGSAREEESTWTGTQSLRLSRKADDRPKPMLCDKLSQAHGGHTTFCCWRSVRASGKMNDCVPAA